LIIFYTHKSSCCEDVPQFTAYMLWEGQVVLFCQKLVHATYVAIQSVPESMSPKFYKWEKLQWFSLSTEQTFSSLSIILPRGRFHWHMKPYTILFITLGRVIRSPPNFAWCLSVYTWRYLATQILQRSQDSEILQVGLQVGTLIGRCQKTPNTLWVKLGIELWYCLHKSVRVTNRELTISFKT
jgi:hypothetical protein